MHAKEPARLTSALLVRKGDAAPSIGVTELGLASFAHDWTRAQAAAAKSYPKTPANRAGAASDRSPPQAKKRVALTLRLDHDRHRRLRLLAALEGRKMHDILIDALDDCLARLGGQDRFAGCVCLHGGTKTPEPEAEQA